MRIHTMILTFSMIFALMGCLPEKAESYKVITINGAETLQVDVLFNCAHAANKRASAYQIGGGMGWPNMNNNALGIFFEGSCENKNVDDFRRCSFDIPNSAIVSRGGDPKNLPDDATLRFYIKRKSDGEINTSPDLPLKDAVSSSDDEDLDGIADSKDNCDATPNTSQEDMDKDGIGDECDDNQSSIGSITIGSIVEFKFADTDGDGVIDIKDECPGELEVLAAGEPVDGVMDGCPTVKEEEEEEEEEVVVDQDVDDDGVLNEEDNCPFTSNEGQDDEDLDGRGDVCDPDFGNSVEPPIMEMDGGSCSLVDSNTTNALPLVLLLTALLPMTIKRRFWE